MDNTENLKILSICSGMLGIERGIKRSGVKLRTVAYVERESFVAYNLVKKMEANMVDSGPIWSDVTTFNGRPFRNRIHGIVGGYPCQGESSAGLRNLEKDPRFLWPHIRRIIIESRPLFCFFENVDGHLSGTFPYILKSLQDMGYTVEAGVFSAAEVGAPHSRKRVFIFACSDIDELRRCLANSNCIKLEGCRISKRKEFSKTYEEGIYNRPSTSCTYRWPSKSGSNQHHWEEKRTIEPGLGCTINGYNFTTDLLRMYGNGVVEQTAEVAWKVLSEKLLKL